ncbi:MAG: FAD-binding protein, partial [Angelakisella sp.]
VEVFTANIQRYIDKLESMGCKFKRPTDSGQREYIPCFDCKNRNWYGIMQQQSVEVLAKRMAELGIFELPHTEIVDFLQSDGQLCGAAVLCADNQLCSISCGALVVAGGGMGGIFRYRLNTNDISGVGQLLAMRSGASLINAEFFQMFLGYKAPAPKTIYNEKMFRYTNFFSAGTDRSIFEGIAPQRLEQLLEERSSHGPFTSRLADREIDRIISEQTAGVDISYSDTIKQMKPRPEFIETYFHWLEEKKGLTIDDKVELGIFAHASNGGIAIDTVGFTGVPGLFACGEATGGMHGADRIGGLSTANCLVFGNRAGEAAAVFSKEAHGKPCCADYSPPWIFQDAAELLC